jgi:hypothetical protein
MQTLDVQRREDVGGGMVLASACRHMGVQNELRISGRINGEASGVAILAVHENGRRLEARSQADGSFSFDVDNGKWEVTLSGTNGSVTRFVEVNGHAVRLSTIDMASPGPPAVVGATKILDFDTLTSSDTLYEIPSGYMGLNFRLWVATHHKLYKGSGYINATTSGEFIAYNSSGYPAEIWSDQPFDFIGTFVGLAWPRGEEQDVIVKAWRNGKLVHEDRFGALNSTSIWFDGDYRGIDRLEFSHGNYERVVIDDFRVRTAQ